MEGLYQNNIYSSSNYIMQPLEHSSYSSSPSSNYRAPALHSAFSDARPSAGYISSTSSPPSDSLSMMSHAQQHPTSEVTSTHGNTSPLSNTYPPASMVGWSSPGVFPWPTSFQQQQGNPHHFIPPSIRAPYASSTPCYTLSPHTPIQRPKLTTTVWEDEGTVCYQVDAKTVCVARRQDNDMINGTKLLNVVGMSRGRRDGILKNEKGRVVVKVGAMHLKGVWITFERAKDLAAKFKITDLLYPLFTDDPSVFLCPSTVPGTNMSVTASTPNPPVMAPSARVMAPPYQFKQGPSSYGYSMSSWDRSCHTEPANDATVHHNSFTSILRGNDQNDLHSGSCSPVPVTIAPMVPPTDDGDMYLMNNSYDYSCSSKSSTSSLNHHQYPHHQQSKLANNNTTSASSSPNYDTFNYDTFFRKPMVRPPPAFPHSPPHEEVKYRSNSLSHISSATASSNASPSSHWPLSLISQLSDSAKTTVPPPLRQPTSPGQKDDLILPQQQQRGRKRSMQSTSSILSPSSLPISATMDSGHQPTIKRLRTLDN